MEKMLNPTDTPIKSVVKFDDTPVKLMLYPAIIFLILGMSFGVFIAFNGFFYFLITFQVNISISVKFGDPCRSCYSTMAIIS